MRDARPNRFLPKQLAVVRKPEARQEVHPQVQHDNRCGRATFLKTEGALRIGLAQNACLLVPAARCVSPGTSRAGSTCGRRLSKSLTSAVFHFPSGRSALRLVIVRHGHRRPRLERSTLLKSPAFGGRPPHQRSRDELTVGVRVRRRAGVGIVPPVYDPGRLVG